VVSWTGVPSGAASTALAVTDPDAPTGEYIHWLVIKPARGVERTDPGRAGDLPAVEENNTSGRPAGRRRARPRAPVRTTTTSPCFAMNGTFPPGDSKSVVAVLRKDAIAQGEIVGLVAAK